MRSCVTISAVLAVVLACVSGTHASVMVETVHVGNAGNLGEQSRLWYGDHTYYGGVNYEYDIGKYEVTAGQYTAFLNAVASEDAYGLYNHWMWDHTLGRGLPDRTQWFFWCLHVQRGAGLGRPPRELRLLGRHGTVL